MSSEDVRSGRSECSTTDLNASPIFEPTIIAVGSCRTEIAGERMPPSAASFSLEARDRLSSELRP